MWGRSPLCVAALWGLVSCGLVADADESSVAESTAMYPELNKYVAAREAEFDTIPAERRSQLDALASYVQVCRREGKSARFTFICTHNSRRSQMAQVWAATAAAHFGVDDVYMYSGGTESTAFNPRAVAALERAGFRIDKTSEEVNPIYHVRCGQDASPLTCFSKVYDESPNPSREFCAVMTCADADRACPAVRGAATRVAIPYVDPKEADDTSHEAAKYDERCGQIAREILYVFSRMKRGE